MQRRNFLINTVLATAIGSNAFSDATDKDGFIVKNGKNRTGQPTPFMGVNPNDVKISAKDTDSNFSLFEYIGKQKIGPPLHMHYHQDETFYVIEGEYIFQLGDKKMVLKAGDTIFLPRNVPHTWIQTTDLGKLLYFLQPAGKMEEFFDKFSKVKGPPVMAEMAKLFEENGMKLMGPPLNLE